MKIKIVSLLLLGLIIPFSEVVTFAQCKQKGIVLEYNRRQNKKPFSQPVRLQFNNVAQINDESGRFILEFLKEKPGDIVSNFKVEPSDSRYILFNREVISNWTLTPQKQLNVELCRKDLIEYLEKTFTRNEMARIHRERDEALRLLNDNEKKIEEIKKIQEYYQSQIDDLKAKVVDFVYKDETTLDSLQLLWREYVLANNYDAAEKVLQQMNLQESTAKRTENIVRSSDISFTEAQKLEQECDFLQKRILSYKKHGKPWYIIKSDYVSLINSYKTLLDTYQSRLRCSDEYLHSLRKKTGDVMFDYADTLAWINKDSCMYWYKEAARLDNIPACYELGNKSIDYFESLKWYKRALELAVSEVRSVWIGHNKSVFSIDDIKTGIESFPDFCYVHEGDSLYFHILDMEKVSLVYLRHSSDANIIKIPHKVKYNGHKYVVSKIGTGAINDIEYGGMKKMDGPWGTSTNFHNDNRNIIERVYLPNTVDTICMNSIHSMGNVPDNLKHLGSWNGFSTELKTIFLPSTMLFMGDILLNDDQTLVIPSSLQEIGETTCVGKVIIHDSNPHFTVINETLYSYDKSKAWIGTVDSLLYIYRELKVDEGWWSGVAFVADKIKEFKLEKDNPFYSEYDEVLYTIDYDTLLFMTKSHPTTLRLHPNTRVITNSHHLSNTYGIKEVIAASVDNVDALYNLLDGYSQPYNSYDYMTIVLMGESIILYPREFDKVISQAEKLCKKHPSDDSFLYFYGLLNVINCDIEGVKNCYSKMSQQSELAKKLQKHIEIIEEKKNDAISYGLQSYHELLKAWNKISNKERQTWREEVCECLGPAVPYLIKELCYRPNDSSIYNIIGLYYSLHDNYPYIKKKAQEMMDCIQKIDLEYASQRYELYEDLIRSKELE